MPEPVATRTPQSLDGHDVGTSSRPVPGPRAPSSRRLAASWRAAFRAELIWLVLSTAVATSAVAALAASPRSWLLFYDGDSMLPALIASSLHHGQPQQWTFSPDLFLPELALYLPIAATGLGVHATAIAVAILDLLILAVVVRLALRWTLPRMDRRSRMVGALAALAIIAVQIALERSPDRNGLELASLMTTSTYYVSTVIAMLLSFALVARTATRAFSAVRWTLGALAGVAAFSTFVNPLYLLWAVAPIVVGTAIMARGRLLSRTRAYTVVGVVAGAGLLGYLARIPLARFIDAQAFNYLDPGGWKASLDYYLTLAAQRASTPGGLIATLLAVVTVAVAIAVAAKAFHHRETAPLTIGVLVLTVLPVTLVWTIGLGTDAARYLQPVMFAPLLTSAIAAAWAADHSRLGRRAWRWLTRSALAAALVVAGSGTAIVASRPRSNAAVDCVVTWIDHSHETGAGTYWTIRPAKAYLDDPAQLVQVDQNFDVYAWLANRSDFRNALIQFTVTGPGESLDVPEELRDAPHASIGCGEYTIENYAASGYAIPN